MYFFNKIRNKNMYIYGYHSAEFLLNYFNEEIENNSFILFNLFFNNEFYRVSDNTTDFIIFQDIISLNIDINNNIIFDYKEQKKIISVLKILKPIEKTKIIAINIEEEINCELLELISELNNKNYYVIIFSENKYKVKLKYCISVEEKSIVKIKSKYSQIFKYKIYFKNIFSINKNLNVKSLNVKSNKSIQELYVNLEKEVYKIILNNF